MSEKQDNVATLKRTMNISYETLFELLRNEKNRSELQKLDNTFYLDVARLISDTQSSLMVKSSQTALFASEEHGLNLNKLENVKKIVKDIYQRREKKIVSLSINKSRTNSSIIDTSLLLPEERIYYNNLVKLLDYYRDNICNKLLRGVMPNVETASLIPMGSSNEEYSEPDSSEDDNFKAYQQEEATSQNNSRTSVQSEEDTDSVSPQLDLPVGVESSESTEERVMVRFLSAVPRFVGTDLESHGPFTEDDVANLPGELANVLISKGRAEEISK